MTASVLPLQVFEAPETWRTVDFISDLHLQDKESEELLNHDYYDEDEEHMNS